MWIDFSGPIIVAHRGDKTHAPENTLAAFKLAAENGADAIEFDVKLTDSQSHYQWIREDIPSSVCSSEGAGCWYMVFRDVSRRMHPHTG